MIQYYRKLKPSARKWAVKIAVVLVTLTLGYPIYRAMGDRPRMREEKQGRYQVLDGDSKAFEDALYTKTEQALDQMRAQIKELTDRVVKSQPSPIGAQTQQDIDAIKKQMETMLIQERGQEKTDLAKMTMFPPSPGAAPPSQTPPRQKSTQQTPPWQKSTQQTPPWQKSTQQTAPAPELGIKTIVGVKSEEKQDQDTIYLPPSFMDASLLTGVVAPATKVGADNPTPMLIRIKDLAVLPNQVKEDLKGCFVVAEGSGDLSQERVKTRLLNMSCITKDGAAIIDQQVKGWVVDADGRAGLSGRVVAKFGSHVARVAISGFLEGFGKALELSVTDTTTNVFGTQSSNLEDTDTDALIKAGGGRAVVNTAKDLQKFYLQLAQQTMPVIEVGPTKNITVIISEGQQLVIKERTHYAQKD